MKPIRILSAALELLGEVDNYLSFSFTQKYHSPGEFQLVTNLKVQNADQLKMNRILMLGGDPLKTGIIRHREIQMNERGEETLTIRGSTLSGILAQRITIPPEGEAQDIIEADAESVMKHYVNRNCKEIHGMEMPELIIGENLHRGDSIKWFSRYQNLAEELEDISHLTELGWRVCVDVENEVLIFDVYKGRNLTTNQSDFPPVIFSPDFDNVKSQHFIDSLMDHGNYAIVAGQGEGAGREITTVGTDAVGIHKHVIFVDARDLENSTDLQRRGETALKEHNPIRSFQAEVLPSGPFKYEKDWFLGDMVTVQNKDWAITMDTQITEITEVYEAGGLSLMVTFGSSLPTLGEKLKKALKDHAQ